VLAALILALVAGTVIPAACTYATLLDDIGLIALDGPAKGESSGAQRAGGIVWKNSDLADDRRSWRGDLP